MTLKEKTKLIQKHVGASADGIYGNNTADAIVKTLGIKEAVITTSGKFPTQTEIWSGKSVFGGPGDNIVLVDLPYKMRLSWDFKTTVSRMSVNEACANALVDVLKKTLDHYGMDKIRELGLDVFGGGYNKRKITGGSKWSMHAYGCAFDIDPDNNQYKWGRDKAKLAKSEYDAFWRFVEEEGGVSLGRQCNYDWMHFQFARL